MRNSRNFAIKIRVFDSSNEEVKAGYLLIICTPEEGADMDYYKGRVGIVTNIGNDGLLYGTWGGCHLVPGKDVFYIISKDYDKRLDLLQGFFEALEDVKRLNLGYVRDNYLDRVLKPEGFNIVEEDFGPKASKIYIQAAFDQRIKIFVGYCYYDCPEQIVFKERR